MRIREDTRKSLILSGNSTIISDDTYKKLLDNCFAVLLKRNEVHPISSLYNSKPDVVKEVYAALLTASSEFARYNVGKEGLVQYLTNDCRYSPARVNVYLGFYEANKEKVRVILGNIGSYLPHIVDAKWKIDYIVKSSNMQQGGGPLFRISLTTEKYDEETGAEKDENVCFTCTSQELQDLVYKLKDAVRHCQRIASEH